MKKSASPSTNEASQKIDEYIAGLTDWRGKQVAKLRKLVHDAAPEIVEEWKWDTPVFAQNGSVVALGVFKDHMKINFFKGAALKDPQHLFNAGLEAKTSRGIDLAEGDKVNETALKALVREAVALNMAGGKKK